MTSNQTKLGSYDRDDTEAGEKIRLKHLAKINPSKSEISHLESDTKVSFVPLRNIGENGSIDTSETIDLGEAYSNYTYFSEGDIAVAKITPSFENGKGAICKGLKNGIGFGTTELHILRPREGVDTRFIWYVLRSKSFRDGAKAAMQGVAGQQRVPSNYLKNFEIERFDTESQERISAYLDERVGEINDTIVSAKNLKEKLQEKWLAELSNKITSGVGSKEEVRESGISWLGEIPKEWDIIKAGWNYDVQLGKKLNKSNITGENLYPYLRNRDVNWWQINTKDLPKMDFSEEERKKFRLRKGDVLVCEGGAGYGESAVWKQEEADIFFQMALHRVRPYDSEQSSEYFCYFMEFAIKNGIFSASSNQSTIEHITTEKITNQKMPLPSSDEQKKISNELHRISDSIEDSIKRIDETIDRLEEKRSAQITKAIEGKIDLNDWQPPDRQELSP